MIIVFLCLGIIGCTTAPKAKKIIYPPAEKPEIVLEGKTTADTKHASIDQKEVDSIISVFSEVIKKNPKYAGAYYNRGIAYFHKNEYNKSWEDVRKAESLGCKFNVSFLESLKKVSGREK
jgi:tetratricopeptide (TPR) repeat protein